ncbi:hypothetical protein THAOC_34032 [Thalassiosira oceanica]|uniref:Uncharacterized protein n=1 Tax=Thalassiosira oceanica TaxID=159749 RepID=K0RKT3_THAOC|nr:hypothetical protein THAOC_34032 [Thalassiosira oceanica]|eukprot:EJK47262.1 hypothetical protein THAOC_34032 [Thalassiosira oceanica]
MKLHMGSISSSAVPFGASDMAAENSCATADFTATAEIDDAAMYGRDGDGKGSPNTLHHKSTPTPTEVDPVYVERRDDFEIASAGTQCQRFKSQGQGHR